MRPMLARPLSETPNITFPLYAQPKLDGVRCILTSYGAQSRSGKLLSNSHLQTKIKDWIKTHPAWEGLDGELIIGDPTDPGTYRATQSVVNSILKPIDQLSFCIFDIVLPDTNFSTRWGHLSDQPPGHFPRWFKVVPTTQINSQDELEAYIKTTLALGYEGAIFRNPRANYHSGRAGKTHYQLLKAKPFSDCECRIIGVEELYSNQNENLGSPFGLSERSSAKANLVPQDTLGALVLDWNGKRLKVGTGFTEQERKTLWNHPPIAQLAKIKYFPHGMKDLPRHPVFLGLRDEADVG